MTKVKGLTGAIMDALETYRDDVEEDLLQAADEISKEAVTELRQTPPTPTLTGDYAKGWARKKTARGYIIHNRTNWQLTHLLEKGHMNRDGSYTAKHIHIKPVEDKVIKDMTDRAEKAARQ